MRHKGAMSNTDAAEQVLERELGRGPLHYDEITNLAMKRRLIKPAGRTPETTMQAAIPRECRDREQRGEPLRFEQLPRGYVGLRKWSQDGVAKKIDQHNQRMRKQLIETLKDPSVEPFESLVDELFAAIGFENVKVTQRHRDGGIDTRCTLSGEQLVGLLIEYEIGVRRSNHSELDIENRDLD